MGAAAGKSKLDDYADIRSRISGDICLDLRFMYRAVLSVSLEFEDIDTIASTGETVIIPRSLVDDPHISRRVAHCILHSVLGHDQKTEGIQALAEDMIVEYILDSLDTPRLTDDETAERLFVCERIFSKVPAPTAQFVAEHLSSMSEWRVGGYNRLFRVDDHSRRVPLDGTTWQELSKQVAMELEATNRNMTGALYDILRIRNHARTDYKQVLRRFLSMGERVKEDPEQFDPIFYTFGLQMYGDLPLMDSTEHSDMPSLEKMVIAIDTSGSTQGVIVSRLLDEAFTAIRQCSMSDRTELHVIQCDDIIRHDDIIRTREDLFNLERGGVGIVGGGQTDFRPVFDYIAQMRRDDPRSRFGGLIYLTDGKGRFPDSAPDYDVLFIIIDEMKKEPPIPAWAMRMVLGMDDLDRFIILSLAHRTHLKPLDA